MNKGRLILDRQSIGVMINQKKSILYHHGLKIS